MAKVQTGADVKSQFSKSGQVMRSSRGSLHSGTVSDTMFYTYHLKRQKQPLRRLVNADMTLGKKLATIDMNDEEDNEVPQE